MKDIDKIKKKKLSQWNSESKIEPQRAYPEMIII